MFVKSVVVGTLILGVLFFAAGVLVSLEGLRAVSWDAVEGEVVSTDVKRIYSSTLDRGRRQRTELGYAPQVTYRWAKDGQSFTGDRYRIGEGSTMPSHKRREEAEEAAAGFPKGGEITVYVDPGNPSSAVLNRAASPFIVVPFLLSLLCLACGAAGWRHREALEEAVRRGSQPQKPPATA